MIKIKVNNFDLNLTLLSGQSFRVYKYEKGFITILSDRVIYIYQDNNYIYVTSDNEKNLEIVIRYYFDLDNSYDNLFNKDDDIIIFNKKYKILNQDKFEMLISYIISQNNNVKRIGKIIDNICLDYGKKITFLNKEYYLFPSYSSLKKLNINNISKYKLGFRDKYVISALEKINKNNSFLKQIEFMDSKEALNALQTISGVGPKVASCILLFGYHRFNVYPIDTYVKKYMKEKYDIFSVKEIEKFMFKKHKNNSGLYIQYIFNYKRNS